MKKVLKWIGIFILAFTAIAIVVGIASEGETTTNDSEGAKSEWVYRESTDRMDNSINYFARIKSENNFNFEFPYNGGSHYILSVRKMGDNGSEIVLNVSNGQFMTGMETGEVVRAKFDENPPVSYGYSGAADGSIDVIFLENSQDFLSRLKQANELLLEVNMYNEGKQHIEFNVSDLEWDK